MLTRQINGGDGILFLAEGDKDFLNIGMMMKTFQQKGISYSIKMNDGDIKGLEIKAGELVKAIVE